MRASWGLLALLLACSPDPLVRSAADAGQAADDAAIADGGAGALDAQPPADAAQQDAGAGGDAEPSADAAPADSGGAQLPEPPPLRPYSGGACPTLTQGATSSSSVNQGFVSAGDTRSFRLMVPRSYTPDRAWPVVFAWHWLNASSGSFVRDGELESAIEEMGFIAVLPDKLLRANGDKAYLFDWPFVETGQADKELTFFDDLLTCVSAQLRVDPRRVYGIGVSAGGLWLTYLLSTDRVSYLAAVESLSGGLGEVAGVWSIGYTPQAHKFPALVLWGGPSDWLGLSFAAASQRLEDALLADDHFVVRCVHDSGHALPPISPPAGSGTRFWSLWRFMLDHPYGTDPSPYAAGLPAGFPDWCALAQ